MKKLILITLLSFLLIFTYWQKTTPNKSPDYLLPDAEINSNASQKVEDQIKEKIDKISEKSFEIQSIFINSIPIKFQQNKLSLKLYGKLNLEKQKNLRLTIEHRLTGKEIDIGSNNQMFWFWSKRLKSSSLHYGYWDQDNTLRVALNPEFLLEAMNFNYVSTDNALIVPYKKNYAVIQQRNCNQENVQSITLVDVDDNRVLGRYLYRNEKMIASCEYSNFENDFPKLLSIFWHEENIGMNWDISKMQVNVKTNKDLWTMPNIKNKILVSN